MTAITDLAGRAAPTRTTGAKARPGAEAPADNLTEEAGNFALLVKKARNPVEKAQPPAGRATGGAATAPEHAPTAAAPAAVTPTLIATQSTEPAVPALQNGDEEAGKAATPAVAAQQGAMAGEIDPATGAVVPASRTRRTGQTPGETGGRETEQIAKAKRGAPVLDKDALKPGAGMPTTTATSIELKATPATSGTDEPSKPVTEAVIPQNAPQTDPTLAAASLVALVTAQQAASPIVERRPARGNGASGQIETRSSEGATGTVRAAFQRLPETLNQSALTDTAASAAPPTFSAAQDAVMANLGQGSPAEFGSKTVDTPMAQIKPKSIEAVVVDMPAASAPVRMFAGPATNPTAEAISTATIDMSVEGQWIDRMAQEISSLAAGTGHSRFELSPPQLGRIQIDLAMSDAGTVVRMMTETDEAADRLRAGANQLQADARMASLPLAGLVIDRAAAGGFDLSRDTGQNSNQQQQAPSRGAPDLAGQSSGQSNGQSSGQSNASAGEQRSKAGGREAVMNDRTDNEVSTQATPAADRRVRFA